MTTPGLRGTGPTTAGPLPARVTTPLLTLITQQSLDEEYEHVAEARRAGARAPTQPSGRGARTLVTILVFGALLAVAAVQTARNADVTSAGREELISRIEARRASITDVQDRIARLRSDNAAAETSYQASGRRLDALYQQRSAELERTGFGPLSGPGVRILVDDAPGGGTNGRVRDDDLTLLVNGLWQAGATGITVNGQRVTALSALRNSGQAIGINGTSLSPPYTVLATGDTRTLQANFAESTSGSRFETLTDQLGMKFATEKRDNLRLSAAPEGMMALEKARSGTSKQQKPPVNQEDTQ